jgi:hypothetical protein
VRRLQREYSRGRRVLIDVIRQLQRAPVRGESILTPRSVSGTDHGNVAPTLAIKRARSRGVDRRGARVWCGRVNDARDLRCNNLGI